MYGKGLRPLAVLTALILTAGLALVFFWTPNDADQGFIQKIFYIHVPLGIVSLCGFIAGGVMGLQYLRTRDRSWDLRSYVAIHLSLTLAIVVLITGSIWAKAAWGHWWVWDEPMLVSFLIVFLLYSCYQPLRFSIEQADVQARYASVFAVIAGAFVPINFAAVRMAESYIHPRTLGTTTGGMPGEFMFTFLVCLLGVALLWVTLWKFELTAKSTRFQVRALKRRLGADLPAPRRSGAPEMP